VNGQSGQNPGYLPGFVNNMSPDGPLVVICAGGDGGPGIIQLHVPTPDGIVPPASPGEDIYGMIKPPPVSSLPAHGPPSFSHINNPPRWNQMFPQYGLRSQVSSMWTALAPVSTVGGSRSIELPSILTGDVSTEPPRLASDARTVVIDASSVGDDVYLRYSALLRGSELRVTRRGETAIYPIEAAVHDEETHELRLALAAGGERSVSLEPGDAVELRPQLSPESAHVVGRSLPPSLRARIEFQTAPDTLPGVPDISRASRWTDEIPPTARHLRFRIALLASEKPAGSDSSTPVPSLDFLRVRLGF
jgi:hypothetical protein